jgi:hypothetical protein
LFLCLRFPAARFGRDSEEERDVSLGEVAAFTELVKRNGIVFVRWAIFEVGDEVNEVVFFNRYHFVRQLWFDKSDGTPFL